VPRPPRAPPAPRCWTASVLVCHKSHVGRHKLHHHKLHVTKLHITGYTAYGHAVSHVLCVPHPFHPSSSPSFPLLPPPHSSPPPRPSSPPPLRFSQINPATNFPRSSPIISFGAATGILSYVPTPVFRFAQVRHATQILSSIMLPLTQYTVYWRCTVVQYTTVDCSSLLVLISSTLLLHSLLST